MTKPKLRNISLQKAIVNGSPFLILKDPEHFSEQMLFIPDNEAMLYILGCLDGEHSVVDIQEDFMRTFGAPVMSDQINDIINTLNENHYLENEDFQAFKQEIIDAFLNSPLRSSSLAGMSYPRDASEVKKLMQSMLDQGKLKHNPKINDMEKPRALICPHIDFVRGGHVYGAIYNLLHSDSPPDIFIILGTVHSPSSTLFIPTRKSFETPLGITKAATEILDDLEKEIPPESLYRDEFLHRGEHSIEFQALWLQYLFDKFDSIRILPILCASIDPFMEEGIQPIANEKYALFLNTLTQVILESEQKVCIIAGADLSHIGSSFGDPFHEGVSDAFLEETRKHDHWVLESVQSLDAAQFFERIASCKNRYRICGLSPIYAMLYLLKALGKDGEGREGIIVDYDQSLDSERTTSVSFTGMIFY